MSQVQSAVHALKGAEDLPKAIRDLRDQTARVEVLAGALADDYECLVVELEVQREVFLRLVATERGTHLDIWRTREASIREQVMAERGRNGPDIII